MLNVSLIGTSKKTKEKVLKIENVLYVDTSAAALKLLKENPDCAHILQNEDIVFNLVNEDEDETLECNQDTDLELEDICDYIGEVCPYVSMYELVLDEGIDGLGTIDEVYRSWVCGDIISHESKEEFLYAIFESYVNTELSDTEKECLDLARIEYLFLSNCYYVEDEDGSVWEILN